MIDQPIADIKIYEPEGRVKLSDLSIVEYQSIFAGYRQLLVQVDTGLVIAACRSHNRDGLIQAVNDRFGLQSRGPVMFREGPATLEENRKSGAYDSGDQRPGWHR